MMCDVVRGANHDIIGIRRESRSIRANGPSIGLVTIRGRAAVLSVTGVRIVTK